MHLGNIAISKFADRKVAWTCDQCPDGHPHKWTATVNSRSNGAGCPQCKGGKLCKHNSLAAVAPASAAYWDIQKNGCTADMILANSSAPAHWHCSNCKHDWITRPNRKAQRHSRCPNCTSGNRRTNQKHPTFVQSQHPLLAEQWDHERNAADGLYPDSVTLGSQKRVHWFCHKCCVGEPHRWTAMPSSRIGRSAGCPFCASRAVCKCNSLQTVFPSIAAEWNHDLNLGTPDDYTARCNKLVWWTSKDRGSWQQKIHSRSEGILLAEKRRQYVQDKL